MVLTSGELRFVANSGESPDGSGGRQDGSRRPTVRNRTVCGATGGTDSYSRRWQRSGGQRSYGGGISNNGRLHAAREEGLPAIRTGTERRDRTTVATTGRA